ncbi:hypothetical protein [Algicella marina]|uniref:Outer membrane protein beta-barrel domain-containing protein n=1 Tax=Algicella marina TaxID=2683284 RepID=A0A6P1SXU3_9RHOB|nr:hypothetical protein [Algicella marina]QHQ34577.1 hypothetical protein GO499_04915 [Algicella marina]
MPRLTSVHGQACGLLLFSCLAAFGQEHDTWLEAGISTYGPTIAPAASLSERFAVRAPISVAGYGTHYTDRDGNTYEVDLSAFQAALMADFHPFENGFRLSSGFAFGGYRATGRVDDPVYQGVTIPGEVSLRMAQKVPAAPQVAVGYTSGARRNLGLFAEIGVRYAPYRISYSSDQVLTPGQRAGLEATVADMNDDLNSFGFTPFAAFGVTLNF